MRATLVTAALLLLASPTHAQVVKLVHINVGQGDATLILGPRDASGERVIVLIDSGDIPSRGKDGGALVADILQDHGLQEIDFFIASHYDADHIGGVVTGTTHHGTSFLLGRDGAPGSPGMTTETVTRIGSTPT